MREVLDVPEPTRTLLSTAFETINREGPEQAIAAIQLATYRNAHIRYVGDQATVVLTGDDGWQLEQSFASGQELTTGLTRFGPIRARTVHAQIAPVHR